MGKYYGVKVGRQPGVFKDWKACEASIKAYPKAEYKKFDTKEEAEAFVAISRTREEILREIDFHRARIRELEEELEEVKEDAGALEGQSKLVAYVDGSYKKSSQEYSYGLVLFHKGEIEEHKEKFKDELSSMRNVAGEIKGAEKAMEKALEYGYTSLDIYYDYLGIEKWAKKEWKANKEGTKAYRDYYSRVAEKIDVNFIKVEAHSGDKYNDLADRLAKDALGIK